MIQNDPRKPQDERKAETPRNIPRKSIAVYFIPPIVIVLYFLYITFLGSLGLDGLSSLILRIIGGISIGIFAGWTATRIDIFIGRRNK